MSTGRPRASADYAKLFGPLEAMRSRYSELGRVGPAPRSAADRDRRSRLGRITWTLALPAISIGVDHLIAWANLRIGANYQPAFGHLTLIRGALEGCCVVRWLCDPAISSGERIRRAAGVQLEDYEERRRFETRMGSRLPKPSGKGRTAVERIDALRALMASHNVMPIKMLNATEFFGMYVPLDDKPFSGEALFRLIGGTVHSKIWSLWAISDRSDVSELGQGLLSAKVGADEDFAFAASAIAMQLATEALSDIEQYAAPGGK